LAGSLYESLIALRFVLKRNVCIIVAPSAPGASTFVARPPSRNNRAIGKASLTRELRAALYLLHGHYERERLLRKCRGTPGLKRALRLKQLRTGAAAQKAKAALEKVVGQEWSYVLNHKPYTYAGLPIESLARLVDSNRKLSQWYAGPYHVHSGVAHAATAHRQAKIGTDGGVEQAFHSAAEEIRGTIQTAAAMLLACMVTVHNEVRRTAPLGKALESLEKDFHRVFRTDH
jgi:hypothetical protein